MCPSTWKRKILISLQRLWNTKWSLDQSQKCTLTRISFSRVTSSVSSVWTASIQSWCGALVHLQATPRWLSALTANCTSWSRRTRGTGPQQAFKERHLRNGSNKQKKPALTWYGCLLAADLCLSSTKKLPKTGSLKLKAFHTVSTTFFTDGLTLPSQIYPLCSQMKWFLFWCRWWLKWFLKRSRSCSRLHLTNGWAPLVWT